MLAVKNIKMSKLHWGVDCKHMQVKDQHKQRETEKAGVGHLTLLLEASVTPPAPFR